MEHHRRTADERGNFLVIADIGALEIDGGAHLFEVGFRTAQQVVDDHDPPRVFAQQAAHDGGADEARPSGDNVMAHDGNLAIWLSR